MSLAVTISRIAPWTGLIFPPVAWAVHHQLGSDLVYYDCRIDSGWITALGLAMILVAAISGIVSWVSRPRSGSPMELANFAAYMGAMSGGLFTLALVFQTMATLMLPPCQR